MRCRIDYMVTKFVRANRGRLVTAEQVNEWCDKNYTCSFNTIRLGKYLSAHEDFEIEHKTNKGMLYRVRDRFDDWVGSLKRL